MKYLIVMVENVIHVFVNYGFSLEINLDNEALMTFELPKNDPNMQ